jgi:hypothetical protein
MKTGTGIALGLFLFLVPSHGCDGGWVTASRAAEAPLTPLESGFSDRRADQILPIEVPRERQAPFAAQVQEQIPSAEVGDDERRGRALETVSPLPGCGSTTDATDGVLISVMPLGSADSPLVVQSPIPPSAHGPAPIVRQR